MPSLGDVDLIGQVYLRANVAIVHCHLRQRAEYIHLCHHLAGQLHPGRIFGNIIPQSGKNLIFQRGNAILCPQNGSFQLFELLGNIALAVGKGLLPDVVLRHLPLIGLGNFNIVAEHPVIAHLELGNAGFLPLRRLNAGKVALTAGHDIPQLVHAFIVAVPDHAALSHRKRRIIHNGAAELAAKILQGIQLLRQRF